MPRVRALVLVLASAACTQVLDLDGYNFEPDPGVGGGNGVLDNNLGGASGSDGTSGSSGGDGTSGSDGVGNGGSGPDEPGLDGGVPDGGGLEPDASVGSGGASGSAGASGNAGTGGYAGASGAAGSSGTECGSNVCVPSIPGGWQGPLAVSSGGGAAACPNEYPVGQGDVNQGLQPGATSCNCGCFVSGISCRLFSTFLQDYITPVSCANPPSDDDCVTLVPDATCQGLPSENIAPNTWATTQRTCGNAVSTGSCTGGSCYPAARSFGNVCISQAGDVQCPSGFPVRSLYFRGIDDRRDCAPCSCALQGDQACVMHVEICSTGFFTTELHTYNEQSYCMNPGEDGGLSVLDQAVVDPGNCDPVGGAATGSATPTNPLTVCCL
ncbi:MAG: hypothetical protein ABI895_30460 [Deltaproteobacteria bacterium]